jgi:purine-binding chemotaxis protein CheW
LEDRIVGLLVESVSEILGVEADRVKETPRSPEDTTSKAIDGIIPSEDDMTKTINLRALLPNEPAGMIHS